MLMQNFKSADDLGLTEPQLSALQKTLVMLETDKLTHGPYDQFIDDNLEVGNALHRSFTGHFNMATWQADYECGSACCIGGTAEVVGGLRPKELFRAAEGDTPLHTLFGLDRSRPWLSKITPQQAARALRSYLTTGAADWDAALAK